jgi:uncharacterized protein (TIGR02996 family)
VFDDDALLAAIQAYPDEDTPRLMYADWLDELATTDAQRARAEFIRVQIELERMPEFGDAENEGRRELLGIQEGALLEQYAAGWLQRVPVRHPTFNPHRVRFRRGFPEMGSFHIDYLRDSVADVFAHPLLRRIGVSPIDDAALGELLRSPWVAELRGLELTPRQGTGLRPDWSLLADCAKLSNLDSLALAFGGTLTPTGADRIAANAALAGVGTLCIKEDEGSIYAIPLLLSGAAFGALARFELSNFRGDRPQLPDLVTHLARLEDLRLGGYTAFTEDIARLTRSAAWGHLRHFEFSYGVLGDGAARTLGAARTERLQSLTLVNNAYLSGEELCGPILWGLHSLDLSGNVGVGAEVVRYLADCPQAVGLRNLSLARCGSVGDATARLLAERPAFSQLRSLDLHNTAITRDGARALAGSNQLRNLGALKIHGCAIGRHTQLVLRGRFGEGVRW